ncbi:hypothetical protein FD19_GL001455 [Lacticaseibacillus thailandensis DSM 22698 = JCM 13996]|uniref:Prepilin type IV endopeptidase peptidase domain-containing protein n=2 Tax=Lacticaseibacillus thailandensis TaxID=381741 RepID=A0A0R2CFC5_9LACO|nr:hypothetical protein FD19_GL001455 [Lacticaseibacillus thailandensis DSM 22698 = JCM 13996]
MSIPAYPLEVWTTIICLYGAMRDWRLLAVALSTMAVVGLLAWSTHGLGSADVLVMGALGACLGLSSVLLTILLACGLGLAHSCWRHTRRIPFVPALTLAGIVVVTVATLRRYL